MNILALCVLCCIPQLQPQEGDVAAAPGAEAKDTRDMQAHRRAKLPFDKHDQIELMSFDGKWVGTDGDISILLKRDGKLLIAYYSYGEIHEIGTYELNDQNEIVLQPKNRNSWIPMPWALDKGEMVIKPPTKKAFFNAARQAGVKEKELTNKLYEESIYEWPFRQIRKPKAEQSDKPKSPSSD